MASIAEFSSQSIATEVMKGMRQKAIQGGTPGRAPLGHLNERHFDNGRDVGTVTVDPERAEHIIWAFDTNATGEWSVTRPAAELEERGLTTKPGPNTPARPLTVTGLHRLLRNPYYRGVVVVNGVEHPGPTSLSNLALLRPHHGVCEPSRDRTADRWKVVFRGDGIPMVVPPRRVDPTNHAATPDPPPDASTIRRSVVDVAAGPVRLARAGWLGHGWPGTKPAAIATNLRKEALEFCVVAHVQSAR